MTAIISLDDDPVNEGWLRDLHAWAASQPLQKSDGNDAAAFILIRAPNEDGKWRYLLQRRHDGTWGLPGGTLHAGESAWEGAIREAAEEMGELPHLGHIMTLEREADGMSITTFVCKLPELFSPSADGATPEETLGWGWFGRKEIPGLPLQPDFEETWDGTDWKDLGKTEKGFHPDELRGPHGRWEKALADEEAFDSVKSPELTDSERQALSNYGSPRGYKVVNPVLHHDGQVYDSAIGDNGGYRQARKSEAELAQSMIQDLDTAFAKAPPLGKPVVVYRNTGDVDAMFGSAGSKVGKTFQNKAYTSTTTNKGAQAGYGFGYESKKGRLAILLPAGSKPLVGNTFERELILPRGGSFKVVGDQQDGLYRNISLEYLPGSS